MTIKTFTRPFTQQEPINQEAIEAAIEVLKSGRLHRYNTIENELSEVSLLEEEYAAYQGSKYCLACASGGYAMTIALKAAGLKPGEGCAHEHLYTCTSSWIHFKCWWGSYIC